MVQKYYNTQDAARVLNVSADDVKKMLERRELHGYRDGADWKFKVEDIDAKAKLLESEKGSDGLSLAEEDEGDDVLLSEVALGQSGVGTSGTVIAMSGIGSANSASDIQLAGSNIDITTADASLTPAPRKETASSKTAQFEELDLTLDEDLSLEDSTNKLPGQPAMDGSSPGGSAIDLTGRDLEDDDLVLGGSSKGSDVTIGGDSGISLIDPADSGLSLEEPLGLVGAGEESLELGEDDMLSGVEAGSGPNLLKTDEEFLLTPLEETSDEESESGSQVIALDTDTNEAAAMMGSSGSMAAMLDEDLAGQPALDLGLGAPLATSPMLAVPPSGLAEGMTPMQPSAVLPEAPYTTWQITGLAVCAVFLMLCGMMMYDLLRNMWSWNGAYTVNSTIMDLIVGLF